MRRAIKDDKVIFFFFFYIKAAKKKKNDFQTSKCVKQSKCELNLSLVKVFSFRNIHTKHLVICKPHPHIEYSAITQHPITGTQVESIV